MHRSQLGLGCGRCGIGLFSVEAELFGTVDDIILGKAVNNQGNCTVSSDITCGTEGCLLYTSDAADDV